MNDQDKEIIVDVEDANHTQLKFSFPEDFFSSEKNYPLKKEKEDKKFNIKINKDDLVLMEEIAKVNEISRAHVINYILHEILQDQFNGMSSDAQMLLARTADKMKVNNYDDNDWKINAVPGAIDHFVSNFINHNSYYDSSEICNSIEYKILKEKIIKTKAEGKNEE